MEDNLKNFARIQISSSNIIMCNDLSKVEETFKGKIILFVCFACLILLVQVEVDESI